MTVKELIQVLSKLPKDAVVGVHTNYWVCGDNDSTGYDVDKDENLGYVYLDKKNNKVFFSDEDSPMLGDIILIKDRNT
jgi:hypothetical protein